jgi:hypothetical protein
MSRQAAEGPRWLLLIHQIPRKPEYLRVKIWRRLQRLGAVPIKNAVYALPRSEERNEDLQWVMREVVAGGGEATLVEASFVQGFTDEQVEWLFDQAREADYTQLITELRVLARAFPKRGAPRSDKRARLETELLRLRRRFDEIIAIDFFAGRGREAASGMLTQLSGRLAPTSTSAPPVDPLGPLLDRTWVTRKGIHVDRMASAWLIRRFIDARARFKWVQAKGYSPEPGELRFDMFEAEFTHIGEACTFEVLLDRTALGDGALRAIAEIVHDIDIKDDRYRRAETPGIASMVAGIALSSEDDDQRLVRATALFDQLYEAFSRRRGAAR